MKPPHSPFALSIRPETGADEAAIHAVVTAAFGRDDEARLVSALRQTEHFIGALSLVAERDARIVGHILFTRIDIRTPWHDVPALALAPLAVHPENQHSGIGARLVRDGLQRCRELGHAIVIVLGHPEYYPRFGFSPARPQGVEAPFPVRNEAFMALALTPEALQGVSGVVRYPAPFVEV
jgi:putative acetyltransferase